MIKSRLLYYGEKDLWHAFPTFDPYNIHSLDAIDRTLAWFEEQAGATKKEEAVEKEEVAEKEEAVEKEEVENVDC